MYLKHILETNNCLLEFLKRSSEDKDSKRLQDVLKTSLPKQMFAGKQLSAQGEIYLNCFIRKGSFTKIISIN